MPKASLFSTRGPGTTKITVVGLASLLTLAACSPTTIQLQAIEVLPYQGATQPNLDAIAVDEDGVHIYERDGIRHRHPVAQTQFALRLLESWRHTGRITFLQQAEINATDLLAHAHGAYLPYSFDFPLHGDPSNTIHGPWYSAMAQGQFLSLAVRLREATGDAFWMATADRFFTTLSTIYPNDGLPEAPWVSFVDESDYLWFEEYAGDVLPMRVLNGHIFAMYGIYDYWRVTDSAEVQDLFDRATQTVEHYVPLLRVEGEPSWYGMRIQNNPIAQSEKYHRIHIGQLQMLAHMTGNERFEELADLLESDFS